VKIGEEDRVAASAEVLGGIADGTYLSQNTSNNFLELEKKNPTYISGPRLNIRKVQEKRSFQAGKK